MAVIKGITIQFGADVTQLNKALNKTQSELSATQQEIKSVTRALKFNPRSTTLLGQKFQLLQRQVEETNQKLNALRKLQKQMDANGVDKTSAQYKQLEREIERTEDALKQAEAELKRFGSIGKQQTLAVGNAMKAAGGKIKSLGRNITTTVSVWGMAAIYAGDKLIDMAEKQAQAEEKLTEIYKSRMGVGKKAVNSTLELAKAEQKLGVVGDEVQLAGAQQLATYAKYPSTVNTMLPALNDLLVQQKGMNGTQEDAVGLANLFGKAMMGQTGALKRAGISFTDAQAEVLKYGTEEEKAAMIAEVVQQNVGDMNEEFAKTDAGKIQQAKNALGDMGEEIGAILLPAVADLVSWFQDNLMPKIQQFIDFMKEHPNIAKFGLALAGIVAVAGPLLMFIGSLIGVLGSLVTVTTALDVALLPVIGIIAAIVAAIAAAIAIGVLLYKNWDKIKAKASALFSAVKSTFAKIKQAITKPFTDAWTKVKSIWDKLKGLFPLKIGKIFSNLKIPKIKIQGGKAPYGIGGLGKKPSISVSWHKKAMENPYLFNNATLFGAGEAGDEVLYGRNALMRDIAAASGNIDYDRMAAAIINGLATAAAPIILTIDGKQIATAQAPYMNAAINQLQARQNRQLGYVGV